MTNKKPPNTYVISQNSKRKGTITFTVEFKSMTRKESEEIDKNIIRCLLLNK